jgi:hypothetical protein
VDFEPLFQKAEATIDAHPRLCRIIGVTNPTFRVDRDGYTLVLRVKLKDSRKRPTEVQGFGETPEEALDHLVSGLDHWAKVME